MRNSSLPQFTADDVEILSTQEVYAGYLKIERYHLRHALFKGGTTPTISREILNKPPAVSVLLFDPQKSLVVMVEQLRIGAFGQGTPWLLEPVAGLIDEGEQPKDAAAREALEEAGCHIKTLIPISEHLTSSGTSNECIYVYCGLVDAPEAPGDFGIANEHEDIRTHLIPLTEVLSMRRRGEFTNAQAVISLLWLELNHASLTA